MLHELSNAVIITTVGMGLVFSAIILLWGLMALLVRLAKDPEERKTRSDEAEELDLKRRAAAVAVSVALERASDAEPHEFPLPPTALVSAWQAVMRTKILTQRGPKR